LPSPARKRRPDRREQILRAAVKLFHEKGYHSTGMDDIGGVAGITGPAIYRHFRSKEEILETVILELSSAALHRAHEIAAEASTPIEALRRLIELYVDALLENPALAFVGLYERRTLRGETRAAIEQAERQHIEEWVRLLVDVRPELSRPEATLMVHAASGLAVAAATSKSGLGRPELAALIGDMMMHALAVERPAPPT
jgi:AcrR family transcriptional regulator